MVYVLMADGFEELEMTAPVDMLRRAGIQTALVGVTGTSAVSARKITVKADLSLSQLELDKAEAIFLPGGGLGVENLSASKAVREILLKAAEKGVVLAAICAAPSLLGKLGLLKDKTYTCFPGFEKDCGGHYTDAAIEWDSPVLTGKAAGVSLEFGATFVAALRGKEAAEKVCRTMYMSESAFGPVLSLWS